MIDSTIGPIPVVSDELIVTDRARSHLIEAKWLPPGSSDAELLREAAAMGWDAAVAAMKYPDGTPVELALNVNPYRD